MDSLISLRRLRNFLRRTTPRAPTSALDESAPLPPAQNLLDLHAQLAAPVIVDVAQLRRWRGRCFVFVRSREGAEGVALGSDRLEYLWPMLTERVLPFFVGKDARNVERLVDDVARYAMNYKIAGAALWSCVAPVEIALFDLLGKVAGRSVGSLLGGVQRREIPVYLSSLRRETTPEQEVALLAPLLATSGTGAVKLKIGGRQGVFDAAPGRTERLVALARQAFGDSASILVDGNGSYTVEQAVAVGRMLESHGVRYFEEPCAWEDFEATRQVADRLEHVQVAGGEQDSSFATFQWMARNGGVDVITPDVINNGGFVRTLRLVRLAAEENLDVSYHSPRSDFVAAYMLHIASATPELTWPHEFLAGSPRDEEWFSPHFAVRDGVVAVPTGPGLGMTVDPAVLRRARSM